MGEEIDGLVAGDNLGAGFAGAGVAGMSRTKKRKDVILFLTKIVRSLYHYYYESNERKTHR